MYLNDNVEVLYDKFKKANPGYRMSKTTFFNGS